MKTYEELLSDIEDDMELMGALHIVYAMEENGVLTGYDYLPEEPYTISVTLKDLQEKIHQQMLYDKASAYTYDSDKSAPKLAVIFPGIGYTADKPLLYYASRLARHYGYQILAVSYGTLPENVKGDHAKMKQAFELAYEQTEQALQDIDWNSYGSILFISKSIGTVIASAYASRHNIKGKSILFTPLTDTFSFCSSRHALHFTVLQIHGQKQTLSVHWLNKKKSLFFLRQMPITLWRPAMYRQIFRL